MGKHSTEGLKEYPGIMPTHGDWYRYPLLITIFGVRIFPVWSSTVSWFR